MLITILFCIALCKSTVRRPLEYPLSGVWNSLPNAMRADLVRDELQYFVRTTVSKGIAEFVAYHKNANTREDCFTTPSGRWMRHRCCVFMSNLAMGMLAYYYAETESLVNLDGVSGGVADALMRVFGVQNAQRKGVYAMPIVVAGVSGTLVKCEFSSVHTFVVFRADDAIFDDIVIDTTYRQFLLLVMEHLNETDVERARELNLLKSYSSTFVGRGEDLLKLFDVDAAAQRMSVLGKLRDSFYESMKPIKIMFDKDVQYRICGR